jgi:acyl-CoA synthetase (AMP-forming)/AMP-acid ligase II
VSSINFGGLVDVQVTRRPDKPAIITPDGTWTYRRLHDAVHAVAARLIDSGIGVGDRVALLGYNTKEYVAALLAIYRVGAIAVPINYRLQRDELEHLVADSGAVAAFADEDLADELERALIAASAEVRARICLDGAGAHGWTSFNTVVEEEVGRAAALAPADQNTVQRIMYTSGTTSRPKGVMITHGMALLNIAVAATEMGLTESDNILIASPIYHVAAMDAPGLNTLFVGGTMVMLRKFDAELAIRMMVEHRVTGGIFVQSILHAIRDADQGQDLSSVRWMMFGAASGELYADIRRRFPDARLIQSYGMTEACSMIACISEAMAETKYGTVGTAVPFVEFMVVDWQDKELPRGQAGEIVLRGPKVTPGYWGDEERTVQAMRNGWFHTGDVGVVDEDGFLQITDRLKDMIRSGGENVASSEIERVIYELNGVQEVAVIGVPDSKWQEVPKAYVVTKPGVELTAEDLIAHCRARLASFKTPKHVAFIEALPRNPSGKVLKTRLREEPTGAGVGDRR